VITQTSLLIFDLSKSLEGPIVADTKDNAKMGVQSIPRRWSVDGKLLPLMSDDGSVVVHRIIDKYPPHIPFPSPIAKYFLKITIYSAQMKESEVNNILTNLLSIL
jgi:hypothetical protein